MSEYLCLRFFESEIDTASVVSWSVLSATAQIIASGQVLLDQLQQAIAASTDEIENITRTIVIVPSTAALLTEAELSSSQRKHLKQVLPYLIEDQVIDPIESMHLAIPVLHEGERVPVVAMAKHTMATYLYQLAEVDISPDYLFLDACCVPNKQGQWQVMLDADRVLFRSGRYSGMSVNFDMADSVLRLAMGSLSDNSADKDSDEESVPVSDETLPEALDETVNLIAADEADSHLLGELFQHSAQRRDAEQEYDEIEVNLESPSADITQERISLTDRLDSIDRLIRSENIGTSRIHYSETASELLAVNSVQSLDLNLNLLQGDFRPANANAQNRRVIQRVSVAIAACLAFFLVVTLGGGFYLNWQADGYFDESVAIYRDLFPKQRKVIDPVKQMKRQLSGRAIGATTSEFLPLLDAASRSLATLEEKSSVEASIKQLRYDVQRGNIAIDIHATDIDELEAYKDLLAGEGLNVDILSANQDGNVVKGRIQIGRS